MKLRQELRDAVWSAVYVRTLAAYHQAADAHINDMAEALAHPTDQRLQIAIEAANKAVERLDDHALARGLDL